MARLAHVSSCLALAVFWRTEASNATSPSLRGLAGGKGPWEFCSADSECDNHCCSNQYSDDGRYKCTPGGTQCGGSGRRGPWEFCSADSECANNCCSNQHSDDGRYKCTPGGTQCGGGGGGGVLFQATGTGTYYYDITGATCPHQPGGFPENNGFPKCTSNTPGPDQLTMAQLGSNNVVAIGQLFGLGADRARWCGKRVVVTHRGQRVAAPGGGDFFVWDGCQACASAGNLKLDFSLSGLRNAAPDACTLGVVPDIQFTIFDSQMRPFVP